MVFTAKFFCPLSNKYICWAVELAGAEDTPENREYVKHKVQSTTGLFTKIIDATEKSLQFNEIDFFL